MRKLNELLSRCAAATSSMSTQDVPQLARLHTDLLSVGELTRDPEKGESVEALGQAAHSAEQTASLVEKLILKDADDAEATLAEISRQISGIIYSLGTPSSQAPRPAAPLASGKPTPAAAPAIIADEKQITDSDEAMAVEFVGEAVGHLDAAEAALLKLEEDPADMSEVNAVFRAFHTIKGVAGFLDLKQIGALAHAAETLLDLARKGKLQLVGPRLDVVLETRDMMRQMVGAVETAAKSHGTPARQNGLADILQRLEAATRDGDIPAAPKPPVTTGSPDPKPLVQEAPVAQPADIVPTPAAAATSSTANAAAQTSTAQPSGDAVVKVSTARLDTLINAVGELVIAQAMVAQDLVASSFATDQRLSRNLSHLGKITRGLQDLSMSMRMVPIAAVFQKMARLARDTARKAGKEVDFVQVGGDTELDRNVVEAISDPLVHMVRNSIDHGLENPEDRPKVGKPTAGRVQLKAFHQSGNVVVEISDDGRGLNQQKLVQKAITAGIIKEGQVLSEQEIFQLVFQPGLSTADKVTDISGRGVGMDVVRKNVEALRGRIEIASTPGKGSIFTVRLPLTLAVIDGLIVKVGAHRYIVPITSIEQSIRPTAAQLSTVGGKGEMCMVRDKVLPLVRLHRLFDVPPKTEDPTAALIVIVQDGPRRCCLLVDELVGQQQVVIKSVGKEIGQLPGIAGCAILGDGNVSLILDVAGMIDSALR